MTDTSVRRFRRENEDETEAEGSSESEELACPECSGDLATDTEHGEVVCQDCGLVVDE
ncbi:transcription initiation factor IIB 2, partial [Halobacteriales archaeon QS_4_70_19]